jgi:hypothetical protein
LVSYIEDPFANADVKGYNTILNKFKTSAPHIKIGIKSMIQEPTLNPSSSTAGSALSNVGVAAGISGARSLSKL